MLIDLVQLRTFVAVAEEQHLTRAAERLHISQSAASAHVRAVEEALDTVLFVRTNRNLELTQAGQQLLRKAKALLNEAAMFASFARELRGQAEGRLVVGSSADTAASRVGEIVAALRAAHPLIMLDVYARPSSGTRQGLKTGELDVGILLGRPTDPGFTYIDLATTQFRVAGPAAWRDQIVGADWAALASLPWITPTDSSMAYANMLGQLFTDRGLELHTVVRFDNEAVGRSAMQAGVGMMLMREDNALKGERDGTFAVSPIARAEFHLLVAYLASRGNDPLIKAFVEAIKVAWPDAEVVAGHK